MSKDVLVFVELKDGAVRKASFELLSKGKAIAESSSSAVTALVLGSNVKAIGQDLKACADRVIVVDHEELKDYRWDSYAGVMEQVIRKQEPALVFGASTVTGKDLFPRLAARLDAGIVSDAIGIELDDEKVRVKKPLFGGRVISWVSAIGGPLLVTFRPNSFGVEKRELNGEVFNEGLKVLKDDRMKVLNVEKTTSKKVDLQEADFIICGGRGMKGPENFQMLESVADVMGGRVGASRAVVDSKWRDYDDQIGKSGKSVSPKLYIGCGVSGALHHTMGMDTSKVIVAINKDPNAPIFQYADYGIVDDLFTVVPLLKIALSEAREET
jgi:electron transfer flavoprotein alpha subunit